MRRQHRRPLLSFAGFFGLALIGLAVNLAPDKAWAQVFNPESFTLSNGLRVVVIPNHRVPVVTHMVWYKVGSADEVAGKSGLAHMLEHMMFKGTKEFPSGEFSRIIAQNGGRDNAFTTTDYTAYYQNIAADKLELAMRLEADRMVNLVLTPKEFEPERQVVLEERRMRSENEPQSRLSEQMNAVLFLNSPYRHPVIGWKNEIERFSVEDLTAFYRRWYTPNNAIVVISGDVTAKQVEPLAKKYYGVISARPIPARDRAEEPEPIAARMVTLKDSSVRQPFWARDYLAPSYNVGEIKDAYALQVLAEIVGGGTTGRLYKDLVIDRELAATAGAGYDPTAVGDGVFSVSAMPRSGVSAEEVGAATLVCLEKLVKDGVGQDEVRKAINRLKASVVYARDSVRGAAQILGMMLAVGRSVEEIEAWPQRIEQVSAADVNRAAQALFKDERSVTGLMKGDDIAAASDQKEGKPQ